MRIEEEARALFENYLRVGKQLFGHLDVGWNECRGAVLCVRPANRNEPLVGSSVSDFEFGSCNEQTLMQLRAMAPDEAMRLDQHLDQRHLTSRQSGEDEALAAGAVVVPMNGIELILSVAGFPGLANEAFCLLLAERVSRGDIKVVGRCAHIAGKTKNAYWNSFRTGAEKALLN